MYIFGNFVNEMINLIFIKLLLPLHAVSNVICVHFLVEMVD